jgi:hypothetical protein
MYSLMHPALNIPTHVKVMPVVFLVGKCITLWHHHVCNICYHKVGSL